MPVYDREQRLVLGARYRKYRSGVILDDAQLEQLQLAAKDACYLSDALDAGSAATLYFWTLYKTLSETIQARRASGESPETARIGAV